MIKREITYNKNTAPIVFSGQRVFHAARHWHSSLEVIWVLEGEIDIMESYIRYHLYEGDVYVVNYNETHRIFTEGEPAVILSLFLDPQYFTKHIHNLMDISFSHYCFSTECDVTVCLSACRKLMATAYAMPEEERESIINALLSILVSNFQYIYFEKNNEGYFDSIRFDKELTPENLERLHRITNYIYAHCERKLTLDELAEKEFYSRFYLSHFIKRAQGLNFQDTLTFSRICHSEKLLLSTNKTIEEVASIVGFSSRQSFCIQFKKWHGILPTEFRKQNCEGAPGNIDLTYDCSKKDIMALIRTFLS